MKRRGIARTTAMAMAAAMILTACGGGNADQSTNAPAGGSAQTTTDNGGSGEITKTDIVVAQGADVVTLDPAGQQDTTSGVLIHHVYSTLMDIDDDGNLVPDLAESYEMKSDTEYTFKLREDACFSDGTPVTAKDVKFTYDRAKDMPKTKSNTSKIAEVIADDDYHVTFKLTQPYAAFKTIVTQTNLSIVSEAAVTAAGDAYGDVENVLGSGEFTVTEWVPNDHYTLTKNEKYWGEEPIATSITVRVIPEGSARTIALEAGEVDLVWNVDPTDCANVEANSDVALLSQPSSSIEYLGMNTTKEKFSDERVRQAVNYALDKQTFVDTIVEGRGTVANSYINSTIPGWSEEEEAYPYDPEKAKEILENAGCTMGDDGFYERNGEEIGFVISVMSGEQDRIDIAQAAAQQLQEIGINCTVDIPAQMDWGGQMACLIGWGSPFDADDHTYKVFGTDKGANYSGYSNEKVDEYLTLARQYEDQETRAKYYDLFQEELAKDPAYAFICYIDANYVADSDIKGISEKTVLGHHGVGIFWNIQDWEIVK